MKKILLFFFISVSLFAQVSDYSNYYTGVGDSVYVCPVDSTYPAGRLKLFRNAFDTTLFSRKNLGDGVYNVYLADTLYQDSLRLGKYRDSRINYAFGNVTPDKMEFLSKTKKNGFLPGWAGYGFKLDYGSATTGETTLELDNLFVRKRMTVYELILNQLRATNGNLIVSDAAKIDSISGTSIWLENPEGDDLCPFAVNDLLVAQQFDIDLSVLSYVEASVDSVIGRRIVITYNSGTAEVGQTFVRIGNSTDTDRQAIIYIASVESGAPFISIMDNISSFTSWNTYSKSKVWLGNLNDVVDPTFGALSGYGMIAQDNIYLINGFLRLSDSGYVAGGKTNFADSTSGGFFIGFDSGVNKFWLGDTASYVKWDGSLLKVKGNVELTSGSVYDSLAWVYDTLVTHRSGINVNSDSISLYSVRTLSAIDSISTHRSAINLNSSGISLVVDSIGVHRTNINGIETANEAQDDTLTTLRSAINLNAGNISIVSDSTVVHRTEINTNKNNIGVLNDTLIVHRSGINVNYDSVSIFSSRTLAAGDSISTHRSEINVAADSISLYSTGAIKLNANTIVQGDFTVSGDVLSGGTITGVGFEQTSAGGDLSISGGAITFDFGAINWGGGSGELQIGGTNLLLVSSPISMSDTVTAGGFKIGGSDISDIFQPQTALLTTLIGLDDSDGNFIVGSNTGFAGSWVVESGSTARTSLGLGTMATENQTEYAWGSVATTFYVATSSGGSPTTQVNARRLTINGTEYLVLQYVP